MKLILPERICICFYQVLRGTRPVWDILKLNSQPVLNPCGIKAETSKCEVWLVVQILSSGIYSAPTFRADCLPSSMVSVFVCLFLVHFGLVSQLHWERVLIMLPTMARRHITP